MAGRPNILLCSNSFKESLNSVDINITIAKYLTSKSIELFPISDGGDGFLKVIQFTKKCNSKYYFIPSPLLNKKIRVEVLYDDKNIYVESANALGLKLIPIQKRTPLKTSSYGFGELLNKIIHDKTLIGKRLIIGVGGTSTNDAGCGMAQALGYKLVNINGKPLNPGGKNLRSLEKITNFENIKSKFSNLNIISVSDVQNPLTGPNGSTKIYAKQKGAKQKDIHILEMGMINFARIAKRFTGKNFTQRKMYGAGGGLAAGLNVFLNSRVIPWNEFFEIKKFEQKNYDYIITGEGKVDSQSFSGKSVGEIFKLSKKINAKLILVCGTVDEKSIEVLHRRGVHKIIPIQKYFKNEIESIGKTSLGLKLAAKEINQII